MLLKKCLPKVLLIFLGIPSISLAHIDELAQVLQPDPLVKAFEAESTPHSGKIKTVDDPKARGTKAVVFEEENSGLQLDFGELQIGMYCVWVCAKVIDEKAVVASVDLKQLATSGTQIKPLYFQLSVNSGVGAKSEIHRMRVPFSLQQQYEYIARIYFHAPEQRDYRGELTLSHGTKVKGVHIDFVELRNPLGETKFAPIKKGRHLFENREIGTMRLAAAKEGKLPGPIRPRPLPDEERRKRDGIIWLQSIMPINANPAQIYGPSFRGNPLLTKIFNEAPGKLGKPIGKWEQAAYEYDEPWVIRNNTLGLAFTMDDYRAGRLLPKPWPVPEDRGGYFFDKDEWGIEASFNYGFLPHALQQRYHTILAALGGTEQGRSNNADLPNRYLLLGDLAAAEDGAFLLAAFAYHYPAYDWNLHCITNIIQSHRTFDPGNVYGRGCSYEGWSTGEIRNVIIGYDKLFPYIQDNQPLADRVGRFVPWVKTSEDVIKLIDTFLVQRALQDGVQHILYSPIVPTAAAVLGPSEVADKYLDLYVYKGSIYFRDTKAAYVDTIINGYSRDGLNYIGSTYYVVGESVGELFDTAQTLSRYVQAGGNRRFLLSDVQRFPRLAAMPDALLGLHIAGGQSQGIGDVHDPQAAYRPWEHTMKGENLAAFAAGWSWSKDPRFAWILANRRGQGDIADREWTKIVEAARDQVDPLLHSRSRVVEGFGTARLEANASAANPLLKFGTMLRFGMGSGHAHNDTLDIGVFAYGIRATSDVGGRSSGRYGHPNCMSTYVHNTVQVDEGDFNDGPKNSTAQGWLTAFKPYGLAQYVSGAARADSQPQVSDYRRGVLQVISDPGSDSSPAQGYVFDVFRVSGGKTHTWCFHGCPSEEFKTNAELSPASSGLAKRYLAQHQNQTELEGTAPAVLQATWKLRRKVEEVHGIKLANAEEKMLTRLYDPAAPEKFTRVHLLGQEGAKLMAANWYCNGVRQHSFPFLYVRRDGKENLQSVYPSVIEPYADNPIIESIERLDVKGAEWGKFDSPENQAVACKIVTVSGQTDLLFSAAGRKESFELDDGTKFSGDVGFISRDKDGLRAVTLVGGTTLSAGNLSIKVQESEFSRIIRSVNYAARTVTLDQPLPDGLNSEVFTVGNELHKTTFEATEVKGSSVIFKRTSRAYRGAVDYIDPDGKFAQLDTTPFLVSYHPSYYDGMTAVNERNQTIGRCRIALGDRYWYTGFPVARRHLAIINKEDLTDENGDGKISVGMFVSPLSGTNGAQKLGPEGELIEVAAGEKMFDLEVTRVREDGLMLFSRQHPREFVDSLKIPHPGWPYHQQIIRNERGDKEWVVNMPGDTFQVVVDGKKVTKSSFPDPDGDGRPAVELHHYGPGDTITAATHVSIERKRDNMYSLRASSPSEIKVSGKDMEVSLDMGGTWTRSDGRFDSGMLTGELLVRLK